MGGRQMPSLLLSPTVGPTALATRSAWPGVLQGGEEGRRLWGTETSREGGSSVWEEPEDAPPHTPTQDRSGAERRSA